MVLIWSYVCDLLALVARLLAEKSAGELVKNEDSHSPHVFPGVSDLIYLEWASIIWVLNKHFDKRCFD